MIIKYFITSSNDNTSIWNLYFEIWQFFSRTLQYFSWTLQVSPGDYRFSPGAYRFSPGDYRFSPGDYRFSPGAYRFSSGFLQVFIQDSYRFLSAFLLELIYAQKLTKSSWNPGGFLNLYCIVICTVFLQVSYSNPAGPPVGFQ